MLQALRAGAECLPAFTNSIRPLDCAMGIEWKTPSELPDLRRAGVIALDTETKDDALAADRGSGWATRQGYVCGVSVAYRAEADIRALYIPIRHPDTWRRPRE
jgi:hypothetical protein